MKETFKSWLNEIDSGDMALFHSNQDEMNKSIDFNKDANEFKNQMDNTRNAEFEPKEGEPNFKDIILIKGIKYLVVRRDEIAFYLKELGSNKELRLKHGYKFKLIDKTPLGKLIYKLVK